MCLLVLRIRHDGKSETMLKGDIGSPEEATKEDEGLRGAKGEGMTKASRSECYDKQMSRCHSRFVDNMIINNVCNVTDYACFYSSPLVTNYACFYS